MKNILKLFILLILTLAPKINAGDVGFLDSRNPAHLTRNALHDAANADKKRIRHAMKTLRERKQKPQSDGCGRCLEAAFGLIKDCCAVTCVAAIIAAPLAGYLWLESTKTKTD